MSSPVLIPYLGLSDFMKPVRLGKCLIAELLGTLLLVFIGCGSCVGGDDGEGGGLSDQANIVRISLCFGLTVATMAATIGHVSGCHVNPAVTVGLIIGAKIGVLKGLLYICFQCMGAVLGSHILFLFLYESVDIRGAAGIGATGLHPELSSVQGVVIEALITLVLVLVVFGAAADELNAPDVKGSPPLAIGLAITTCHLFAIPLTGSSMNPARSLGPAVVLGNYSDQWVYWAGPLTGGVVAALLYQGAFRAKR